MFVKLSVISVLALIPDFSSLKSFGYFFGIVLVIFISLGAGFHLNYISNVLYLFNDLSGILKTICVFVFGSAEFSRLSLTTGPDMKVGTKFGLEV